MIIIVINCSLTDIDVLLIHLPCADLHPLNLTLIGCIGGNIMIHLHLLSEEIEVQKVKVVSPL